ncbi:hypothetical protein Hanom_Chr06g00563171 [Helianthus anomalus]
MTGESEVPEGERLDKGGDEVEDGGKGTDWERSGGVKKPTWRTLGSMTVRGARRWSIGGRGGARV